MDFGSQKRERWTKIPILHSDWKCLMIEAYTFGRMIIGGKTYQQDIIIHKGKVFTNWWRKTGHRVTLADLQDILTPKPDTLILGKGMPGFMKATPELRKYLEQENIQLIEKPTAAAVKIYNKLYKEGKNVSAGFHLTC
jgi:hypothetical protein